MTIEPYPVLHQEGVLSVEMELPVGTNLGDVGIQIARDGRIWICYNGQAYIRFKPLTEKAMEYFKEDKKKQMEARR